MIPDTLKDKTTKQILKLIDIYLDNWYPASVPPISSKPLLLLSKYNQNLIRYASGYYADGKYYDDEDLELFYVSYYKYSDADKVYELLTNKKDGKVSDTDR